MGMFVGEEYGNCYNRVIDKFMKLFSLITICIISLVACVPPGYFSEVNGKTIATNFKEVFISDDYFKLLEFKVKVLPMIIDSQDLIFPDSNSVIYHSRGFRIIADYSLKLNYDSLKINQSLELSNIQILKKSKPMDYFYNS
jgi:hypothetical protein